MSVLRQALALVEQIKSDDVVDDAACDQLTELLQQLPDMRFLGDTRPPHVTIEADGKDVTASDTVLTVLLRRPLDNKVARINVNLSARHDGNEVIATLSAHGLTETSSSTKQVKARFCWVDAENGDGLDYPEGHPARRK